MSKPKAPAAKFKQLSRWEIELGERIAAQRRYAGSSQSELAKKLGLTRDQLSSIEIGRVPLRFWTGWKLCHVLNLNPLWLLLGGDLPEQPFTDINLTPHLPQIGESDSFSEVCKRVLYVPIKDALRDAGVIVRPKAFAILRKEWIADQVTRAKQLRSDAAQFLEQAEEIELAIAVSKDFHAKHPKG
ncbi:MAG: helix-turn-helix transcriptional regulator [Verrucomicrobiota bacterium]